MVTVHKIATPETVDLHLELAGLGNRLQAKVVDLFWKWMPVAVIALGLTLLDMIGGRGLRVGGASTFATAALILLLFLYMVGWEIYFEMRWNGQTPGKRLAGVRVIDENGYPLSFRQVVIRNLVAFADMLPVFYFLGGVVVFASKKSQRLGDMAAGTLVVRERETGDPRQLWEGMTYLDVKDPVITIDRTHVERFTAADRKVLKVLFLREPEMDAQSLATLMHRIAVSYLELGGFEESLPTDPARQRQFLGELYLALREARI